MAREAFDPCGQECDTKDDNSPVTKTDIAINQMVIDQVKARFPNWGGVWGRSYLGMKRLRFWL